MVIMRPSVSGVRSAVADVDRLPLAPPGPPATSLRRAAASVMRVSPKVAAEPGLLVRARRQAGRPPQRPGRRATGADAGGRAARDHDGRLPRWCGRQDGVHQVGRPGQQFGVAQRLAADGGGRRTRHHDRTDRRLDERARVEPGQPHLAGLGQLRPGGTGSPVALQDDLVQPGAAGQHAEPGHREQRLDRCRAAVRSGPVSSAATSSTAASVAASASRLYASRRRRSWGRYSAGMWASMGSSTSTSPGRRGHLVLVLGQGLADQPHVQVEARRPRCGRSARRRAGCRRRGSRGPSSRCACRSRGRCAGRWSPAARARSR